MFIQPVSMACSPEQHEKKLRDQLINLGYSACIKMYPNERYIEAHKGKALGRVTKPTDTFHIEEYNPELFLAIAAMTNYPYGVVGEWWYANDSSVDITVGEIYKSVFIGEDDVVIIDDAGYENVIPADHRRKATLEEILEHFDYKKENKEEMGLRYNDDKRRWSLVDFEALEGMVDVLEFGANKYADHNWKKGLKTTGIVESLLRHTFAYLHGEDKDKESGLRHIDHIMCNAMFLSHMDKNKPELDDRYKK